MRYLVDVDGVVADLMGGFEAFFYEKNGVWLHHDLSTVHSISQSSAHADLHAMFDLDAHLKLFLSHPDVYQEYVHPVPNAVWVLDELRRMGHTVGFVTAIFKGSPTSYDSKQRWLECWFPGIPMLTAAAEQKGWVHGDRAIDDRYDTCMRWEAEGTRSLLFRRPWNEAPPGTPSYDWLGILDAG